MHTTQTALHRNNRSSLFLLLALALQGSVTAHATVDVDHSPAPDTLQLHVPSPDWRDQIIYFVLTDRFDDGDPGNNDQGAGEFDPTSNAKYNGGDLKGIIRRLDYIRGLGATTVWITPPVANQWWNVRNQYGGYHGYWAEHLMQMDAHVGTLQDYRELSDALHRAGMYLVQDVVVNHMGDYYSYPGEWDPKHPGQGVRHIADSRGRTAPTQAPFDQNDPGDPAQRRAGIYHWNPAIKDYNNPEQVLDFQMSDLDDLNTDNPLVREALRESYGYWIKQVGVDGMRVDTALYVAPDYFADFMHADDPDHPGMARVAAQTGRKGFHVFGEALAIDQPNQESQARHIDRYMRTPDGEPLMPGMINFPLYGSSGDVFARGRPPAELGYRIQSMMRVHEHPQLMPTFVDNHDVDRFLSGGNIAGLKQSLLLIMTLPGIPTLYYGTEQGFSEQRAAMFAQGYAAGGRDHFDTDAPLYRFIQRSTALRREHRLFSRGTPTVLKANAAAPGVLAYRMDHEGQAAIVVFNSSESPTLLDNLDTDAAPGTLLRGLFGIEGLPPELVVDPAGRVSLALPARAGMVWQLDAPQPSAAFTPDTLTLDPLPAGTIRGDFLVSGQSGDGRPFQLVVDGDLDAAQTITPGGSGRWQATVDTGSMIDAALSHSVVAWQPANQRASQSHAFKVVPDWQLLADQADPKGDDAGPQGRYLYPTDPGWRLQRPLDIEHVRIHGTRGALKIELKMHQLTALWNPVNGFDHVAFTVFVQVPGQEGGITAMPLQNAQLPADMHWNYRLRSHGWSNTLFSADGASASQEGTPVTPSAVIHADRDTDTLTLILPSSSMGAIKSWSGVKLYLTTWDYDGGYRGLGEQPQSSLFGGGDGAADPLVMDDVLISLP